jgi:hypothetical protein
MLLAFGQSICRRKLSGNVCEDNSGAYQFLKLNLAAMPEIGDPVPIVTIANYVGSGKPGVCWTHIFGSFAQILLLGHDSQSLQPMLAQLWPLVGAFDVGPESNAMPPVREDMQLRRHAMLDQG